MHDSIRRLRRAWPEKKMRIALSSGGREMQCLNRLHALLTSNMQGFHARELIEFQGFSGLDPNFQEKAAVLLSAISSPSWINVASTLGSTHKQQLAEMVIHRSIHTGHDFLFVPNRSKQLPLKCMGICPLHSGRIPICGPCEQVSNTKSCCIVRAVLLRHDPKIGKTKNGNSESKRKI